MEKHVLVLHKKLETVDVIYDAIIQASNDARDYIKDYTEIDANFKDYIAEPLRKFLRIVCQNGEVEHGKHEVLNILYEQIYNIYNDYEIGLNVKWTRTNEFIELTKAFGSMNLELGMSGEDLPDNTDEWVGVRRLELFNASNLKNISKIKGLEEIVAVGRRYGGRTSSGNSFVVKRGDITEIPGSIVESEKLRTITLNYNRIKEVPRILFEKMDSIELNLVGNLVNETPYNISAPACFGSIDLSYNRIKNIPEILLRNSEYINLSFNEIIELPENLPEDVRFSNLILYYNEITEVPEKLIQYVRRDRIPNLTRKVRNIKLKGNKIVPGVLTAFDIDEQRSKDKNYCRLCKYEIKDEGSNQILRHDYCLS